jgi:hypothetical protein
MNTGIGKALAEILKRHDSTIVQFISNQANVASAAVIPHNQQVLFCRIVLGAPLHKVSESAVVGHVSQRLLINHLEAFLADWGVGIARHTNTETNVESNYLIKDTSEAYRMDPYANQAIYVEAGLGASLTRQLRSAKNPKAVMFPYAGAIENTYDLTYNDEKGYYYGKYYENGVMRESFDVFTSSDSALAMAGEQTLDAKAPFSYMKVTRETIYREETNESTFSYLLACSSTDFVSAGALDVANYGNHTVLTRACQELGGAQVSVSLACKYFADMEINTITSKAANQYTVVLTVVPAAVIFIAGVYIMIRRKYA